MSNTPPSTPPPPDDSYELDAPKPKTPRNVGDKTLLDEGTGAPKCPQCGKGMRSDAVVCFSCGYDLSKGQTQRTTTGVDEKEPPPPPAPPLSPGRKPGVNTLLALGGGMLVIAIVLAGWTLKHDASLWIRFIACFVVVLQTLTHVGTGLVALWVATHLVHKPIGIINLAALRMFVAVAAFLMVLKIPMPVPYIAGVPNLVLAVGAYWVCVLLLFTREVRDTNVIAALHATVALVLYLQTYLWSIVWPYITFGGTNPSP